MSLDPSKGTIRRGKRRMCLGLLAIVLAAAVIGAGCSSASEWTEQEVLDATLIWVNQTGLNQRDPDVWSDRLDRICEIGYTPGQAMRDMTELAGEFVAEDADVSMRSDGTLPTAEEAVRSLWTIAHSPTCEDSEITSAGFGPYDPKAEIRLGLISVEPSGVEPGGLVSIFFPDERTRGIHFTLESLTDDGWNLEYHLISDWGGGHEPKNFSIEKMEAIAVEDIGIGGDGPDVALIPTDIDPGEYRLCTGNSRPNICTRLTIEPDS